MGAHNDSGDDVILQCLDNPQGLPSMQFNFTPIADIEMAEVNSLIGQFNSYISKENICIHFLFSDLELEYLEVSPSSLPPPDVIGVCKNPGELATVITRSTGRKVGKSLAALPPSE